MEYLNIPYQVKHPPVLDPGFVPFGVWGEAYLAGAKKPIAIAIARPDGHITVRHSFIRGTESSAEADYRYVERYVKFLLWAVGGCRIYVCGCPEIAGRLQEAYNPDGERNFEAVFFKRIYEQPFTLISASLEECPQPHESPRPIIGGHLDGCRIGFDASGYDCKVAAVIDGNCVFSREITWSPKTQADPEYHYRHIVDALSSAAQKMPQVDAIGISSAGIFTGNSPMAANLFMKVPRERWEEVKTIYTRAASQIGDMPLAVVNDRDVTALSVAMSTGAGSLMGLSLGVGEAVGYADKVQNVLGWINELSMAPVDLNEEAPHEELSMDIGAGNNYFSQDAVIRLAAKAGIELDAEMSQDEKLIFIQQLIAKDDPRAQAIYETIGQYLAYTLVLYSKFYELRHLMLLGRVTAGKGGEIILNRAGRVLAGEFPELACKLHIPDEKSRRVGQSVAAASLPKIG